jgi:hypothetical protein
MRSCRIDRLRRRECSRRPSPYCAARRLGVASDAAPLPACHRSGMSNQAFTTILPTLVVGWLMVVAGLGKRKLDLRPSACPTCGRRLCRCGSRR